MSRPQDVRALDALTAPVNVKHPRANRYFEAYRRGQDFYQSEYELDAQGKEVFRDEHKIDYVMGSGANGFSCLVQRGDYLFEAPLSYYSNTQTWELSPGYEQQDLSFSRPVTSDCVSCHSGRPQPVEPSPGKFLVPPFLELAIGCERCHGPGALHVIERQSGAPLAGPVDRTIVNPARLPGWSGDNICMTCHQAMDAAVLMPGKQYSDFRPGTPLADTLAIFAVPFRRESPPSDPMLQHFVLMKLSRCYEASGGRLHCITCHDPHRQPEPFRAAVYYRGKCLTCHTDQSCGLGLAARRAQNPPDNCIGCHMPKQTLRAISHSSLTDHRIPARAGEALPESAFHLTTLALPNLVYLDPYPESAQNLIPPLVLFRAYGQLVATHPEYQASLDSVLDSLAKSDNQDPAVLAALAIREMNQGSPESKQRAANYLRQAIRAGSKNPQSFDLLATLQAKQGDTQAAVATAQAGLEADPYSPRLYRLLVALYISKRAYDSALNTMKKDLELFPEDSFMRSLWRQAQGARP